MKNFEVSVSILEPVFFTTNMTQTEALCDSLTDTYESLPQSLKEEYGKEYLEECTYSMLSVQNETFSQRTPNFSMNCIKDCGLQGSLQPKLAI